MPLTYNENISEAVCFLAMLPPQSLASGAHTIGPFKCSLAHRVMWIIQLGTLGGTIDFKMQASSAQAGTYADVPGVAITTVTAGASNLVLLEFKAETLGSNATGPWVQGILTLGTAASLVSVLAVAGMGYSPATNYNVVVPAQIVVT